MSTQSQPIERCTACLEGPRGAEIVRECIPVPCFGRISSGVQVVTVGLNPALTEWQQGDRWRPAEHRLPILRDFGVAERQHLSKDNLDQCKSRREQYFTNGMHPFFEPLELLLQTIDSRWSYKAGTAIHIDLVACATRHRWRELAQNVKADLKTNCKEHLDNTLRLLPPDTVLLANGSSVWGGLMEAAVAAEARTCKIPCAVSTDGFNGHFVVNERSLRCIGWSTPISKADGPAALAIALWVRRMAIQDGTPANRRVT